MNISSAFISILIFCSGNVWADSLDDSFNKIGTALCDKNILEKTREYKTLKLKGSKVEGICLLTAKTALSNCAVDTAKIYKGTLSSKEKSKVSKLTKSSLQFCSDYADVISTEIIRSVSDKAVADKSSVDEAANKVIEEASK